MGAGSLVDSVVALVSIDSDDTVSILYSIDDAAAASDRLLALEQSLLGSGSHGAVVNVSVKPSQELGASLAELGPSPADLGPSVVLSAVFVHRDVG